MRDALRWLWGGYRLASNTHWGGFDVALGWLWGFCKEICGWPFLALGFGRGPGLSLKAAGERGHRGHGRAHSGRLGARGLSWRGPGVGANNEGFISTASFATCARREDPLACLA